MITLGVLHATLPTYMKQASQEETKHFRLLSSSTDLVSFKLDLAVRPVRVLVLDLALLGEDPVAAVKELESRANPELTLVVYAFARWETVEALRGPKRQVMRAPISVRMLHSNLIGLIVREMTQGRQAAPPAPVYGVVPTAEAPARRYDDVQLASLQEIRSQVQCECPNQVADLVLALVAFEQYSIGCRNRNAEDAKVHAMLARATGHARALMESAMAELCQFEKIEVERLPKRAGASAG